MKSSKIFKWIILAIALITLVTAIFIIIKKTHREIPEYTSFNSTDESTYGSDETTTHETEQTTEQLGAMKTTAYDKITTTLATRSTPQDTKANTEKSTLAQNSTKKELSEFQLDINGVIYDFPIYEYEFLSKGWVQYDMSDDNVFNSTMCNSELYNRDGMWISVCLGWRYDDPNVYINDIYIRAEDVPEGQYVKVAHGIELGKSTKADVKKIYGENCEISKYRSEDTGKVIYEYCMAAYEESDTFICMEKYFVFNLKTGILEMIIFSTGK